jgi:hypothetical protein
LEKLYSLKFNFYFLDQKLQFTYPQASIKNAQAQEKPSALKREHLVLKNMKILDFFLFLWVIFALLDPDPATQINADPCGSGSETLILGTGTYTVNEAVRYGIEPLLGTSIRARMRDFSETVGWNCNNSQ